MATDGEGNKASDELSPKVIFGVLGGILAVAVLALVALWSSGMLG